MDLAIHPASLVYATHFANPRFRRSAQLGKFVLVGPDLLERLGVLLDEFRDLVVDQRQVDGRRVDLVVPGSSWTTRLVVPPLLFVVDRVLVLLGIVAGAGTGRPRP